MPVFPVKKIKFIQIVDICSVFEEKILSEKQDSYINISRDSIESSDYIGSF